MGESVRGGCGLAVPTHVVGDDARPRLERLGDCVPATPVGDAGMEQDDRLPLARPAFGGKGGSPAIHSELLGWH